VPDCHNITSPIIATATHLLLLLLLQPPQMRQVLQLLLLPALILVFILNNHHHHCCINYYHLTSGLSIRRDTKKFGRGFWGMFLIGVAVVAATAAANSVQKEHKS